jgi:hypothetical protein
VRAIGSLSPGPGPPAPVTTALFDALSDLGWIEGKNIAFERRYAENRLERLPLAAEFARLRRMYPPRRRGVEGATMDYTKLTLAELRAQHAPRPKAVGPRWSGL